MDKPLKFVGSQVEEEVGSLANVAASFYSGKGLGARYRGISIQGVNVMDVLLVLALEYASTCDEFSMVTLVLPIGM